MKLDGYDVIMLDCDGVIFNSNQLKIDAFRSSLRDFDETLVENFIKYLKRKFGTSRYQLVDYFIHDILDYRQNKNVLRKKILSAFSVECVKLYKTVQLVDGVIDFCETYREKDLYVVSGSDENELQDVLCARELDHLFKGIYGSPKLKTEIVSSLVCLNDTKKNSVLIGDSSTDYDAAVANGVDFIYAVQYSLEKKQFEQLETCNDFKVIQNVGELI